MAFITKDQAKRHLLVEYDARDADLEMKMQQAEEIVIDYFKRPAHGWTEANVPKTMQATILLVLAALFDDRDRSGEGDYLTPGGPVARLLSRHCNPAIA
jgi:hypothetical protein